MRLAGLAVVAGIAGCAAGPAPASAETGPRCAAEPVSVYFAGGAVQPTPEASQVLARAGRELAQCQSGTVSVVARFSPQTGGAPLQLALDRLAQVASALERAGVDISRVRVAAMPVRSGADGGGPGRVDVWSGRPAASTPRPSPPDQSDV